MSKSAFEVNLITLGDAEVGKTSLIIRYIKNSFSHNYLATLGVDSQIKRIKLKDGQKIKVIITDTAGQERFKSIAVNYIKKANGILLIYDITNKQSFENINNWAQEIKEKTNGSIPMILIGNKTDLEEKRCISEDEGEKFAVNCNDGISFYETSCKTGKNVEKSINELVNQVYQKYSGNNANEDNGLENSFHINEDEIKNGKRKCCKE